MKQNNGGFSLVEVVAAIAILGMFFAAACSSLVLGLRINEKSDQMLQEQLAVSTAVETLMAEGITPSLGSFQSVEQTDEYGNVLVVESGLYDDYTAQDSNGNSITNDRFHDVSVTTHRVKSIDNSAFPPYYQVTVTCNKVTVTTFIREVAE